MTNELNKSSNNDPNPERHFYKTTNPKDDITHILGQQKIDDINKSDTTPDKNAIIELSLTYKQIQENIKDMDNYLDFMRLVIGSPHYAPDITGTIDTNYPIWKKTHNEITQWM